MKILIIYFKKSVVTRSIIANNSGKLLSVKKLNLKIYRKIYYF